MDLDKWIEQLKRCEPLREADVKASTKRPPVVMLYQLPPGRMLLQAACDWNSSCRLDCQRGS